MKTKIKILLLTITNLLFVSNIIRAQSTGATNVYNAANFIGWGATSGDLPFKVNNTTHMTLQNTTGNFGVGTASPAAKLSVQGNTQVGSIINGTNGDYTALEVYNTTASNLSQGNGAVLQFYNNSNNYNLPVGASIKSVSANSQYGWESDLILRTAVNNSYSTQTIIDAITIKSYASVGIGTSTPGAKLEVAGQVKITGGTPGAGKILISDANGLASWSTVGANGGWSTTGNASTVDGTNFIGTTDDKPFNIRVNNQKAGRIDRALWNTFFGYQAGNANTTGYINTANGYQALYSNTTGYSNTALGHVTLKTNTTGSANVACGDFALELNTTGNYNSATGVSALSANTSGSYNTAVNQALVLNTTGSYNTGVGFAALGINTTGSHNTVVGYNASPVGNNYSNSMFLGSYAGYWGGNNTIVLGNGYIEYLHCQVNLTVDSDKRIKDDIKENVPGLAFISKLRPVTYHYNIHRKDEIFGVKNDHNWDGKYDIEKKTMTGFIAQEVEQSANQIGYDFSGVDKPKNDKSIYSLRYAEFVVPLVKAVQEQQQMIDSLKAITANQNAINKSLQQQIDNLISNKSKHSNSINNSNAVNTNIDLNDKNVVVLEQNIPNPFAEQTIINYNLPDNFARAQIIFLDQSGKLIKAVDLTEKGRGVLNIFANDLSSGIYTYSLIIDGQTIETKKMMKTK